MKRRLIARVTDAPKGQHMTARGNAPGRRGDSVRALKGRHTTVPPLQGGDIFSRDTQGDALGWFVADLQPALVRRALCCLLLAFAAAASPAQDFGFTEQPERLVITSGAKPVAHFVFKDDKILRPYFAHVHTPDGLQVTRNHPPIAGKDAVDHDTMHPGLWLAFGDISGNDFWRNKAVMRHERFTTAPMVKSGQLTFATESSLVTTNGAQLATLASRFVVSRVGEGFLLTWDAAFTPAADGFYFGDQEEMGFGVRVATELTEKKGGVITSSSGATTAKGTWGKTANWCDYSGVLGERRVGIAVFAGPQNFRPSWFHNRDYGLMVANPFGDNAFTKGPKSRVPVAKGETFRLRFGAWIHSLVKDGLADVAGAWQNFQRTKPASPQ